LELWSARSPKTRLQKTIQKVLLYVRQDRCANERMPSPGKRAAGRGEKRVGPADLDITFSPRPMADISIFGRRYKALLDSGSMKSFISTAVEGHCYANHYRSQGTGIPIRLANGAETSVDAWYNIPVEIGKVKTVQQFGVMPDLTVDVLVGVDILAQLGIGIPPPPKRSKPCAAVCTTSHGGEAEAFQRFLATELPKFDSIRGPTDLTEHKIRLKTDLPIKQRYRPRNPAMQRVIDDEVREMERAGVIEPSQSPWSPS